MISILFLLLLLMFSAVLSSSETAFFSLSAFTVSSYKSDPDNRKKLISHLLEKPRELLVTILILNTICNVLVQNTVSDIFGTYPSWLLKVGLPLILTLFIGEIFPKSIAITNNKAISYKVAPLIAWIARVLGPIRIIVTEVTGYVSRFMFFFLKKENPLSTDELYYIIDNSKKTGVLNVDETELASGYLDLQESTVREIMRPKDEIIFYNVEEPLTKLINVFSDQECSRVPVCQGGLEKILGVISVTQFFLNQEQITTSYDLIKILKKPFYIPETTNGWDLLSKLRENNEQIAIAVDEYGSVAGLLTQEDLMEMVVGEVEDLRDTKQLYTRSSNDVIIVDAKMELVDIEELFDVEFVRTTSSVTIGGWLSDQFERIPQAGDKHINDDFLFYVLEAGPQKVILIYIRRLNSKK